MQNCKTWNSVQRGLEEESKVSPRASVIGHVTVFIWLCIFTQWSYSETFRDSLATYPLRHIPPLVPLFFSPFASDISPKRPGWRTNKNANSKCEIFQESVFLAREMQRWIQASPLQLKFSPKQPRIGPELSPGQWHRERNPSLIFQKKTVWKYPSKQN